MLRQVIDWAASRSTELLTRYKQMTSTIGVSYNFSSREYNDIFQEVTRNRNDGRFEELRPRGRRTQRNHSGEPFQTYSQSRKQRRRQARRQQISSGTELNQVASRPDGKRRCLPADRINEEVTKSSDLVLLDGLALLFNRRIRLPLSGAIQTIDGSQWSDRGTYAQIVRTPKVARDEWLKQLNRQTETMMTELDKWRSHFRIFSVTVEVTGGAADELGDSKGQDTLKHQILVQRLQNKLREYFGEIFQFDELIVSQDGTKHKSMHFGPTEDAVEREIRSQKSPKKAPKIGVVKETVVKEKLSSIAPTDEELVDSFSGIEDKFWSKQDHYLKRKSGKASRKRLRGPGPRAALPTKREIACMEGGVPDSEERSVKLPHRKSASSISENANLSSSLKATPSGQGNTAQSMPKRLVLMQAKYRRLMKKMEKARKDEELQTSNPRR